MLSTPRSTPLRAKTHVRNLFRSPNSVQLNHPRDKSTNPIKVNETNELRKFERTQLEASTSTSYQSALSRTGSPPSSVYAPTPKKRFTLVDNPTPASLLASGNSHSKGAKPLQSTSKDTEATRKRNKLLLTEKNTRFVLNTSSDESDVAENLDGLKPKTGSKPSFVNFETSDDSYEEFVAGFSQAHAYAKLARTSETSGLTFSCPIAPKVDQSSFKESSRIGTTSTPANKKRFTISTEPVTKKASRSFFDRVGTSQESSQKEKLPKATKSVAHADTKATSKRNQYIHTVKIPRDILHSNSDESDVAENVDVLGSKAPSKPSLVNFQSSDDAYEEFVAGFLQAHAFAKQANTSETTGLTSSNYSQKSCRTGTPSTPANKKRFTICTEPVTENISRFSFNRTRTPQESSQKEKLPKVTHSTLHSAKIPSKPTQKYPARNKTSNAAASIFLDSSDVSGSESCLAKKAKEPPEKCLKASIAFVSDSDDDIFIEPKPKKLTNPSSVTHLSSSVSRLSKEKETSIASSSSRVVSSPMAGKSQKKAKQGNSLRASLARRVKLVSSDIEASSSASETRLETKRVASAAQKPEEDGFGSAACKDANHYILQRHESPVEAERISPPTMFSAESTEITPNNVRRNTRVSRRKELNAGEPKAPAAGQSALKNSEMTNNKKTSNASQSVVAEAGRRITRQNATSNTVHQSATPVNNRRILKEIPLQSQNGKHATSLGSKGNKMSPLGLNSLKQTHVTPLSINCDKRCILLRNRIVMLTPPESRENSVSRSSDSNPTDSLDGSSACSVGSRGSPCNGVVTKDKVSPTFKMPEPVTCRKRSASAISTSISSEQAVSNTETSTPGEPVRKKPRVGKPSPDVNSQAVTNQVHVTAPLEASAPAEENLTVTSSVKYILRSRSRVSSTRVSKLDLCSNRSLSAAPRLKNKPESESEGMLSVSLPEVTAKKIGKIRSKTSIETIGRLMSRPELDNKLMRKKAAVVLDSTAVEQWQKRNAAQSRTRNAEYAEFSGNTENQKRPTVAKKATKAGKQKLETPRNQNTTSITPSTSKRSRSSMEATKAQEAPNSDKKSGRASKSAEKNAVAREAPKSQKKRGRQPKAPEKISPPTFEGPPRTVKERQQIMRYLTQKEEEVKIHRTDAIYGRREEWADVLQSKMEVSDTSSLQTPTTPCSSFLGTPSASRLSESEDERRRVTPLIVRNTVAEVTKYKNVQMIHKAVKEREKQARNLEKEEQRKQKQNKERVRPIKDKEVKEANEKKGGYVAQANEDGYITDDEDDLALADHMRNFSPVKVAKKLFYTPNTKITSVPPSKENDRSSGNLQDMRQVVERTIQTAKTKRRKFKYNMEYNGCPLEITAFAVVEDEEEEREFSDSESEA